MASTLFTGTMSARTPFMLESDVTAPSTNEAAGRELRGVVSTQSGYVFGIYDPSTRLSIWLGLDETIDGLTVRSYNSASDTVTAEIHGKNITLALKAAKVTAVPDAVIGATNSRPMIELEKELKRRRELRQPRMVQQSTPTK